MKLNFRPESFYERLLSPAQAMAFLGVSPATFYRWQRAGKVPQPPAYKGRTPHYCPDLLKQFKESGNQFHAETLPRHSLPMCETHLSPMGESTYRVFEILWNHLDSCRKSEKAANEWVHSGNEDYKGDVLRMIEQQIKGLQDCQQLLETGIHEACQKTLGKEVPNYIGK